MIYFQNIAALLLIVSMIYGLLKILPAPIKIQEKVMSDYETDYSLQNLRMALLQMKSEYRGRSVIPLLFVVIILGVSAVLFAKSRSEIGENKKTIAGLQSEKGILEKDLD